MIEENLDIFLDDFGVTSTAGNFSFRLIFDEEHSPMELGAEGRQIIATAKTTDIATFSHGDALIILGTSYRIIGIRPIMDGKFTELDLKYA
jgi:hypothetical protein